MKILFSSYAYAPGVGGIETVSALLAREFVAAGHELVLITETPSTEPSRDIVPVVRRPAREQLRNWLRSCDVLFQNNISLHHLIPALWMRKPALVVHQTWMRDTRGFIGWNNRIKRALVRKVKNVAISEAIAAAIPARSEIIGNPYDDSVFRILSNGGRDRDIIFVGRLVSDKGADVLLRAVAALRGPTNLTICGGGPEEQNLRALARDLRIDAAFVGTRSGAELAKLLNQHQIIAIPSRWPEPFGIVALEGIACGCVPVGSQGGGLPEAIGHCGVTFASGNVAHLAACLRELLTEPSRREELRAGASPHLERFRAGLVARRYLELLAQLTR